MAALPHLQYISMKPQRGGILVQFSLVIGVLIAILAFVDIGYMYYAKRDLQRIADQAAIEAVQGLQYGESPGANNCAAAGKTSIEDNWPLAITRDESGTTVECGNWSASANPPPRYFSSTGELNAAHVIVQGTSPTLLPGPWSRLITAEAVAKREAPLAVFSVGTTLVSVGCNQKLAPLVQLLKVVGVGDPCVTVGGYNGLVGAQISASGLLKALGLPLDANLTLANVNSLLAAEKIGLGKILDTAVTLAGHSEFLSLNAELLSLIRARLKLTDLDLEIPLGSGPNGPGIFAGIHAPDEATASALDVQLNVLDIVTAAIGVGTSGRGVSIPSLKLGVPGILPLLEVKAGIIEPPSIGLGGIDATAYNAQVRLYVDVDTNPPDKPSLLGGLLGLLGTRIHLPIFIDAARATATVEDISCKVPGKDSTARIKVDASVADVCIGKVNGNPFSIQTPICKSLQNETLVSVLGLVKIKNKIHIPVLEDSYISPDMKAGDTWRTPGNSLKLGETLSKLVNELLRLVGNLLGAPNSEQWTPAENQQAAQTMADYYLGTGPNALPRLPTVNLGLHRPKVTGAYNTDELVKRLSADIDRSGTGCFLGISFLCWKTNEWQKWGNSVGNILPGSPDYIGAGSCHSVQLTDVSIYNSCVRDKLAQELLSKPQEGKQNFLQVLMSPLLALLKEILDALGDLLAGQILSDLLGIDLGLTDVHLTSIGCGNAQLVY